MKALQPGAGHQTHAAGASLPALIACAGHARIAGAGHMPIAGAGHMPIAGGGHAPVAGVTGAPIRPGARNAGGRAIGPAYRGRAPASMIRSRFMPGYE
ncbi:MAG TPA: hypothetical protein VK741_21540 [Acetobacteraceae bacterium]|nr:hypothetical protein [Acetobacteraceae bacterium]